MIPGCMYFSLVESGLAEIERGRKTFKLGITSWFSSSLTLYSPILLVRFFVKMMTVKIFKFDDESFLFIHHLFYCGISAMFGSNRYNCCHGKEFSVPLDSDLWAYDEGRETVPLKALILMMVGRQTQLNCHQLET